MNELAYIKFVFFIKEKVLACQYCFKKIVQAQKLYYISILFSHIIHTGPGLNRQLDWEEKAVS